MRSITNTGSELHSPSMSNDKPTSGGRAKKKKAVSLIRSSAAEYLTFVASSGAGGVEAVYADENVWVSQKMMGQLYDVETHTINYHVKKVFADSELQEDSVVRNFRITAADGNTYDNQNYNVALRRIPMTVQTWETRLNRFIAATDREISISRTKFCYCLMPWRSR